MNVMKQAFGEYIHFTRIWYRQTDAKLNILQVQSVISARYMSSTIVDIKDTHS